MRVTQQSLTSDTLERLRQRTAALADATDRVSSGQRRTVPSDDPVNAARSQALAAQGSVRSQQERSARDADNRLNFTDAALSDMGSLLERVRDLALEGASGSLNLTASAGVGRELAGLAEDLTAAANASYAGQGLFSGFAAGPAVDDQGALTPPPADAADHRITRNVGDGERLRVNVTAAELLATGDPTAPTTIALINEVAAELQSDTPDLQKVSTRVADLTAARDRITDARATLGITHSRIRDTIDRLGIELDEVTFERAELDDIDLAEAITELRIQEVAYEATLGAMARTLQVSLLDFVR